LILVFDLDDTLYDETTFVKSGFKAVARYLNADFGLSENVINSQLIKEFEKGRGEIFDNVLKEHNLYSKSKVKSCISVYRGHKPAISLSKEGKACIERFKKYSKYIVTDGNKVVQYNKIKALGIETKFKKCFITYRYGRAHSKPSPYCFNLICKKEKVGPSQVVYIGDNVSKDFVGIKPLGFRTIQVMTGQYTHYKKEDKFLADFKIKSLDELTENWLTKKFNT